MSRLTEAARRLNKTALKIILSADNVVHSGYPPTRDDARQQTVRHIVEAQEALDAIRRELEEYSP
jgi:hypothetical protein